MYTFFKFVLIGLIISLNTYANEASLDLHQFLKQDIQASGNVVYFQVTPEYETNLDPDRAVTLEFYIAEFSGTEEDEETLKQVKKIIDQDKININGVGMAYDLNQMNQSSEVQSIRNLLKIKDDHFAYEEVPSFVKLNQRAPNSVIDTVKKPRVYWSLVRGFSNLAGATATTLITFGVSPQVAIGANLLFGFSSGASTYYNNVLDRWMNRGIMARYISKWLLNGEGKVATGLRNALKINALSVEESILRNTDYLRSKYPDLYKNNPQIFEKLTEKRKLQALKRSKSRLGVIVKTFVDAEMYLFWMATEIFAVAVLWELPKYGFDVSQVEGWSDGVKKVWDATLAGILSQAPAEFAILKIKYREFQNLKNDLLADKIKIKDRKELIEEIDKVLANEGEFKRYTVNDKSHKLLQQIESKARAKGAIISVLAMTGVAMKLNGMPIAEVYIGSIVTGGALYFAHAQGWIPYKLAENTRLYKKLNNKMERLKAPVRYCSKMLVP